MRFMRIGEEERGGGDVGRRGGGEKERTRDGEEERMK